MQELSTTYNTSTGDTFAKIARRVYGDDQQASIIQRANPGVQEPLPAGVVLFVPDLFKPKASILSDKSGQEVVIRIDGHVFQYWTDARLNRAVDVFDTLEISAPFDPNVKAQRDLFRPFKYSPVQVQVGQELIFNGTLVGVVPVVSSSERTVQLSCYSLPGVLGDCTAPASSFPLEFNGLTLDKIARQLAEPFGLDVQFEADPGPAFEQEAIKSTQTVLDFLTTLAKQNNLIISNTNDGALLFWQPAGSGQSTAILKEGSSPVMEIRPFFSPQEYFSHITGVEPIAFGLAGSQHTVKNPRLVGALRPFNFEAPDVSGASLTRAVQAKAGRMFANMVSYEVDVCTWRNAFGRLWNAGDVVSCESDSAMIYSRVHFLIRSVSFRRSGEEEMATLDLVLKSAFTGVAPESLPWD